MFLTREEIAELTGKKLVSHQTRALGIMGMEFRTRPDGSLVVLRAHVEKVLGLNQPKADRQDRRHEPNWSAI